MVNNFLFSSNKKIKSNFVKSQRQLKVGEELRHLISNALIRGSFYDEHIENNNITITEVNVSPDLKNAKARLKKIISRKISLRQFPRLVFSIDETFEQAKKINDILGKIKK